MLTRRFALAAVLAAGALLPALPAVAQDDIMSHIVGQPSLAWNVYGASRPVRQRDAAEVPGGKAVRVEATRSANAWDIGAGMPVDGDIAAGDVLLVAVWARVETPPAGQQTTRIPAVMIQQSAAPYTPVITGAATLTSEWQLIFASGTAPEARPRGSAGITLHLGGATQTIDLGPAFVFNLGQGYDLTRLPRSE